MRHARIILNLEVSCSGEVLSILVKGHSHDAVGQVESFLYTISVMDVNINVKDTLVTPKNQMRGLNRNEIKKPQT